jgi:hypothetical protein
MQLRPIIPILGLAVGLSAAAHGDNRHFTYSYETTTMAAGAMELETTVTWKTDMAEDPDFERFDIRHEFEFGVTDKLQMSVYFADWRYEENATESGKAEFHDIAVEAIYNLTDPNTTAFGSALYGEIKGSDDFIELEAKLLLQKNFGAWMAVYNAGGEIEWEDDYSEDEAELFQTLGLAYRINPSVTLGAEALHEIAVPDVSSIGDSGVFVGPNMSWPSQPCGRSPRLPTSRISNCARFSPSTFEPCSARPIG